jgi:alpha-galactosidase
MDADSLYEFGRHRSVGRVPGQRGSRVTRIGMPHAANRVLLMLGLLACLGAECLPCLAQDQALRVAINPDGRYSVGRSGSTGWAFTTGVAAQVDGRWLHSADYPQHAVKKSDAQGYLGAATEWQVIYSGLSGEPNLVYRLRAYSGEPYADIEVSVENGTAKTIHVEAIRSVDASNARIGDLDGPAAEDRVLSDSFSEDRPAMTIHDLGDAENQMHRAVGSQLIYNRRSRESLLLGALTSDRFLTILRLKVATAAGNEPSISGYEVDSTGTTEMAKENSLQQSPAEDRVELSLPVAPGGEMKSERLLMSVASDYHRQLETYGSLIRQIHNARISAPPLMGWWSWTAFYFGLNEGAALTNAQWEAEHLKSYGYDVFHIDEGYQYARGEYTTANAPLFPHGLGPLEYKARGLGLVPGIWTAPFEVSERSWIYEHHPEWLVKNAKGTPIHAGIVVDNKDRLFILDTTNPEAQEYLRNTYSTLVREWGVHYIKMDFMDDSAIEGYYYKPNTTALEAQRIGLKIIRDTVGDDVYLDKDGSPMMNPVGFVDYGRISQDTGHTFEASKEAATGIAARYYMNRNFFVADPDAFAVSTQTISDQSWHESKHPATLEEARVAMALAAVSGGMLEIGDNLPSLQKSPERIALLENEDLIDMVRLGRASSPVDLMSYSAQDGQPSVFYLKESDRQSVLTVFNWTEKSAEHKIELASLGLPNNGHYLVTDALESKETPESSSDAVTISLASHSVRVLKIIDTSVPEAAPVVALDHPSGGAAGETLSFAAQSNGSNPVISYRWDFGDGVKLEGSKVSHAWTEPGDYAVHVTAKGLTGQTADEELRIHIAGYMSTTFEPSKNKRLP